MYDDPNNQPPPSGGGGSPYGALIDAGVAIYNNYKARKQSKENTRMTNQANIRQTEMMNMANRELAEYQYRKDYEMWQEMNQYNSPGAQMSRLKAAGLNPNLVYGSNAPSGQSGPAPDYEAPTMQRAEQSYHGILPSRIPPLVSEYQNVQMRQAQIDNVNAQTEATNANTVLTKIKQALGIIEEGKSREIAPHQVEGQRLRNELSKKEIEKAIKMLGLMDVDKDLRGKQLEGQELENEKKIAEKIWLENRNTLREQGIHEGDNVLLRIMVKIMSEAGLLDTMKQGIINRMK